MIFSTMKLRTVRLGALGLAGALALGLLGVAPAQAATPTVTVKGHVRSTSGTGIKNVVASVYYRNMTSGQYQVKRTRTSSTGRYEVKLPESFGDYRLKVTDPGDNDRDTADGRWAPVLVSHFDFTGKSTVRNVVLQPGAKLSGRIYDRTGKAASGLKVYAQGTTQVGYPFTYTRKDGAYYFSNLNAGTVSVLADSPSSNGTGRLYQRTNSAGTQDYTKATDLQLRAGGQVTGISIYFPAVSKITGRVRVDGVEPYGEGGNYVNTVLYDSQGRRVAEYFTNPTFQIRDLPAGTYYLGFEADTITPEFYADATTLAQATPIVLRTGGAVTGLVAELSSKPAS